MRGKHGSHAAGPASHLWSDEKMIASNGYVKLRVGKAHPLADPNGYAYEHLVVWCASGRERPCRGSILHHRNEVRTDNRLENLELLSIREHADRHGRLKLTAKFARSIRETYAAGEASQAELAHQFGVPFQRISKIVRGEIWQSAGGPIADTDNRLRDPSTGKIVGKRRAGRLLDGRTHDDLPWRDAR